MHVLLYAGPFGVFHCTLFTVNLTNQNSGLCCHDGRLIDYSQEANIMLWKFQLQAVFFCVLFPSLWSCRVFSGSFHNPFLMVYQSPIVVLLISSIVVPVWTCYSH